MKADIKKKTDTHVTLNVQLDEAALAPHVAATYDRLRKNLRVAGFRPGKAPNAIVERELGSAAVQNEVLESATNHSYGAAIGEHGLAVIASPELKLTKFVPYTELEYEATAEILPPVKLADYKHLNVKRPEVKVETDEIERVVSDLQRRLAARSDVDRAAANGDEVVIDFAGTKNGEPVPGAKSDNYPLTLGSGSFIPGFEDNLVGMKGGQDKEFEITFPKDYAQKDLAGQKVKFKVTLRRVVALTLPALDEAFATQAGPYKNMAELKAAIEQTILQQKSDEANQAYEQLVLNELQQRSQVKLPDKMLQAQVHKIKHELEQNLQQRGLTLDQYASAQGTTPEAVEREIEPEAKRRVELALLLTEVAKAEAINVSNDEVAAEIARLKSQYTDREMQREIDRPETREEVYNHLMASRTIAKIISYNEAKS